MGSTSPAPPGQRVRAETAARGGLSSGPPPWVRRCPPPTRWPARSPGWAPPTRGHGALVGVRPADHRLAGHHAAAGIVAALAYWMTTALPHRCRRCWWTLVLVGLVGALVVALRAAPKAGDVAPGEDEEMAVPLRTGAGSVIDVRGVPASREVLEAGATWTPRRQPRRPRRAALSRSEPKTSHAGQRGGDARAVHWCMAFSRSTPPPLVPRRRAGDVGSTPVPGRCGWAGVGRRPAAARRGGPPRSRRSARTG